MSDRATNLQDLPSEILNSIALLLDYPALATASRACARLRTTCKPILESGTVLLKSKTATQDFVRTIQQQPGRASHVLSVTIDYADDYAEGDIADILPLTPFLSRLAITAEYDDYADDGYYGEEVDRIRLNQRRCNEILARALSEDFSSIAALRFCTLRYHGDQTHDWNLNEKAMLLLNPTLHYLSFERAFHWPSNDDEVIFQAEHGKRKGTTLLKTLRLIRCNIETDALAQILGFPRALEHFTLTNFNNDKEKCRARSCKIEAHIHAITSHRHSLQSLHLQLLGVNPSGVRLDTFTCLEVLDMEFHTLFGWPSLPPKSLPPCDDEDQSTADRDYEQKPRPGWPGVGKILPKTLTRLTIRFAFKCIYNYEQRVLENMIASRERHLPQLHKVKLLDQVGECGLVIFGLRRNPVSIGRDLAPVVVGSFAKIGVILETGTYEQYHSTHDTREPFNVGYEQHGRDLCHHW